MIVPYLDSLHSVHDKSLPRQNRIKDDEKYALKSDLILVETVIFIAILPLPQSRQCMAKLQYVRTSISPCKLQFIEKLKTGIIKRASIFVREEQGATDWRVELLSCI